MKSEIIEIKNLWHSFNGHPVLMDVTFNVQDGEFLALIGPNGGGKTTLLKIILGLIKPDKGVIKVFGQLPKFSSRRIGYVPQDIHINKNFPVSAMDVVLMGRLKITKTNWPGYTRKDHAVVRDAFEKMEMWGFRNHKMDELSGGQRQRIFIARALVTEPDVLFLDEPTASIDTTGQTMFYELLKKLNEYVTIILASHDMMILSSFVKSVACINRNVHYHNAPEFTEEMLNMYQCPVEVVAHGMPHRVLKTHQDK